MYTVDLYLYCLEEDNICSYCNLIDDGFELDIKKGIFQDNALEVTEVLNLNLLLIRAFKFKGCDFKLYTESEYLYNNLLYGFNSDSSKDNLEYILWDEVTKLQSTRSIEVILENSYDIFNLELCRYKCTDELYCTEDG